MLGNLKTEPIQKSVQKNKIKKKKKEQNTEDAGKMSTRHMSFRMKKGND